jgi:hypothetical protein
MSSNVTLKLNTVPRDLITKQYVRHCGAGANIVGGGTMLQARRLQVRSPDEVVEFFQFV